MKTILLFAAVLTITGCSTPFDEYNRPNGPSVVDMSIKPSPTQVVAPVVVKKDEEEEVKTFPIDLDRN
jgi:hypothetical protein